MQNVQENQQGLNKYLGSRKGTFYSVQITRGTFFCDHTAQILLCLVVLSA